MSRMKLSIVFAAVLALSATARAGKFEVGSGSSLDLGTGQLALGCADLDVLGTLSAGTVGLTGGRDVTITPSGVVSGGSATLELSGDWDNTGSFVAGTSTVRIVDGCGLLSGVVNGDSTFHNLELATATARQVSFTAGSTQTVTNVFDATGAVGNLLRIRSTIGGTKAFLNVQGTGGALYVDVEDNSALPGNNIPLGSNSVKGPNTPGWLLTPEIPLLPPLAGIALVSALLLLARKRLVPPGRRVKSIRISALGLGAALALASPSRAGDVSVQLDAGAGLSVKNSTGAIQRLRVDEATGNVSRNGALFVHTTGANNTFVGVNAGNTATTGAGGNSALGSDALRSNTTGLLNSAFGFGALRSNTTGTVNTAVGYRALFANTTGSRNSALGDNALRGNIFGTDNSALGHSALGDNIYGIKNSAVGSYALSANTTGNFNSAFGSYALRSNFGGESNSAVGFAALHDNTDGVRNVAVGVEALRYNSGGNDNAALGSYALRSNTNGIQNAAVGGDALRENTMGVRNTALGYGALRGNTTGSVNIAIGRLAGINQTIGSDNIYIANFGVAAEAGRIKIGNASHTETFIEGIDGNTAMGGVAVLINSSNELHTLVSSARFKQDVRDMDDTSDLVMKLRPVTFRYREEAVGADGAEERQYGLIAEEVAQVAPDLVALDLEGRPYSVKYHVLPALLLNEIQKQQLTIEAQRQENGAQQAEIAALAARLARVESATASTREPVTH